MKELSELKKGDIVIWVSPRRGNGICKITAITPKYIKIGLSYYRKDNGKKRGADVWDSSSIRLPVEGEINRIREVDIARKNIKWILSAPYDKMSFLDIQELKNTIEEKLNGSEDK